MKKANQLALLCGALCSLHLSAVMAARSLVVTVYPHNELANLSDAQLDKDYFKHWLDEMRSFTNHPIEVIFRRNIPGITDLDYRGMSSSEILQAFTEQEKYLNSSRPFSFLNKHLLLTRDSYDKSGLNYNAGLAYIKGNTAIASMAAYGAPAHEIGHMLSASHEDAELKFNGWVCETYTHPRVPARSNCYRYSDKNRENIVSYLKYNSN